MPDTDPSPCPLDHLPLRGNPAAPALLTREGLLDYRALEQVVGALAAALRAQGLEPGDRVAGWLPKNRLTALLPLACARAALVHVPINPLLKRRQVAHVLTDAGARLLLTGEARLRQLGPGDRPDSCRAMIEAEWQPLLSGEHRLEPSGANPGDLTALLYTSGSSGPPKGVMLSHANLWLGAIAVATYLGLRSEDRLLALLPFSFDYGQNQLLSAWAAGACVVPLDYLAPRDVIRAVDLYEINTVAGVPPLWVQLVETAWPPRAALKLRRLTNSGGKLAPSVIRRMREMFPLAEIHSMYGLTEAFRSTSLAPERLDAHADSIGTEIPFAEVLLVDEGGQVIQGAGEGELVHAGPLVAQGYWNEPERTARCFRPAPAASRYGRTAVWSGDRVRRDADGLLYFVGRADGMIKSAGNRISPTEVEEAAIASGFVAEAVAIGVPDDRLGQVIALVARADGIPRENELRAYLKRELPTFMQPGAILWRDTLPRSPNGKLDRRALEKELVG